MRIFKGNIMNKTMSLVILFLGLLIPNFVITLYSLLSMMYWNHSIRVTVGFISINIINIFLYIVYSYITINLLFKKKKYSYNIVYFFLFGICIIFFITRNWFFIDEKLFCYLSIFFETTLCFYFIYKIYTSKNDNNIIYIKRNDLAKFKKILLIFIIFLNIINLFTVIFIFDDIIFGINVIEKINYDKIYSVNYIKEIEEVFDVKYDVNIRLLLNLISKYSFTLILFSIYITTINFYLYKINKRESEIKVNFKPILEFIITIGTLIFVSLLNFYINSNSKREFPIDIVNKVTSHNEVNYHQKFILMENFIYVEYLMLLGLNLITIIIMYSYKTKIRNSNKFNIIFILTHLVFVILLIYPIYTNYFKY